MADERIEAAKAASVGQLLFRAARLWNEAAIARVRSASGEDVRVAHTALFPHIALDGGTRASEIAAKTGMKKQVIGRLVDELVAQGLFARVPDPTDGRAQRIVWTPRGKEALLQGLGVLAGMEREARAALGDEHLTRLHRDLTALIAFFEPDSGR